MVTRKLTLLWMSAERGARARATDAVLWLSLPFLVRLPTLSRAPCQLTSISSSPVSTALFCATLCFMNTPIRYPQQGLETYDRPGGGPARHNHRSTHRLGAAPYQQRSRPLSPSGGGSPLLTGMNNFPTSTSGDYLSPLAPQSRGPRQSPDVLFTQQQPPQPGNPVEEQDPMDALYPPISYSTTAPMVPAPPGPPSPAAASGFTPSELEGLIERYKVQSLRNKVYAFPQVSILPQGRGRAFY